jgi:hypothetical protein
MLTFAAAAHNRIYWSFCRQSLYEGLNFDTNPPRRGQFRAIRGNVMAISLFEASIPVFEEYLNGLSALLDKAESHAAAKKIDPSVICATRLFPDMFPLSRQVQIACDFGKNTAARLSRSEPPKFDDSEKNLAELKGRVTETLAFLAKQDSKQIDATSGHEIIFPLGPNKMKMVAERYLLHFAMPNFFFHMTAAYAILRHCGIDIGKRDFMGNVPGLVPA